MSTDSSRNDSPDEASRRPSLFRWYDLVVLLLILLLAAGFLLPAVATVRDCSIRLQCINNLHQIGLGIHNYHNTFNSFPNPDVPPLEEIAIPGGGKITRKPHTIYTDLLPFIEQGSFDKWKEHPTPVTLNLCPSRRSSTGSIEAPDDYAIGIHPDWFAPQTTPPLAGPANGYAPPAGAAALAGTSRWFSVLGGRWIRTPLPQANGPDLPIFPGTDLGHVVDADGTSNTLLMAHKGMAPNQYTGGSPSDLGWNVFAPDSEGLRYEHMRCPFGAVQDFNGNRDGAGAGVPYCDQSIGPAPKSANSMDWLVGSPHVGSMPCLFADGSVRGIRYGSPRDPDSAASGAMSPHLWAKLWAFNDSLTINTLREYEEPAAGRSFPSPAQLVTDLFRDGRMPPLGYLLSVATVVAIAMALYVAVVVWIRRRRRTNAAP